MDTIKLSIVTPNGPIFNDSVKTVTLPGKEGEFGVLPGHASLVSSLTVGVIVIEKANSTEAIAINWGHVKVSETSVDVLADGAVALTQGPGLKQLKILKQRKNWLIQLKIQMYL